MTNEIVPQPNSLLYTSPDGEVRLQVFLEGQTIWLTQKRMAQLFDINVRTISEHLKNIYQNG